MQVRLREVTFSTVLMPGCFRLQEKNAKVLSDVRKAECDLNWFLTALPSHQEVSLNPCTIEESFFFPLIFLPE